MTIVIALAGLYIAAFAWFVWVAENSPMEDE
jgi:hypothetical protein